METAAERARSSGGAWDSAEEGEAARGGSAGSGGPERLAPRELMAIQMAAHGYSAPQIEYLLVVVFGPGTNGHDLLERAVRALGAANVPEAIAEARRRGLVPTG